MAYLLYPPHLHVIAAIAVQVVAIGVLVVAIVGFMVVTADGYVIQQMVILLLPILVIAVVAARFDSRLVYAIVLIGVVIASDDGIPPTIIVPPTVIARWVQHGFRSVVHQFRLLSIRQIVGQFMLSFYWVASLFQLHYATVIAIPDGLSIIVVVVS